MSSRNRAKHMNILGMNLTEAKLRNLPKYPHMLSRTLEVKLV